MGMFDRLKINGFSIINMSSEISKILKDEIFQTKSLYRNMDYYEIKKDGGLYREEKDNNGIFWDRVIKTIVIKFYIDVDENWISFEAKYKRGKLKKIECKYFGTIVDYFNINRNGNLSKTINSWKNIEGDNEENEK